MTTANILLVEDDCSNALELEGKLNGADYEIVDCVSNLKAVIDLAIDLHPDIVFIKLELMDDVETAKTIQQFKQKFVIPIIFFTSNSILKLNGIAGEMHPFEIVQIPFELREFHKAVEMAKYKHDMERKVVELEERIQVLLSQVAMQADLT
jgi:AmiR/NasT family two-component response regulator